MTTADSSASLSSTNELHVMFVDDDEITRMIIGEWLAEEQYKVTECSSAEEAMAIAGTAPPHIVVTDLHMTGLSGLDLTAHIKKHLPATPVVLITSTGDMAATVQALNIGVDYLLIKPIDRSRLMAYLRRLAGEIATQAALAATQRDLQIKTQTLERIRANESAVGACVQEMILYRAPARALGPVRSSHRSIPALQVSGDFLDCFPHTEHCFDVVIGDAMGKGLGAALLSTGVKTAIMRHFMQGRLGDAATRHDRAGDHAVPSLESLVSSVRDQVHGAFSSLESFVTFLCVRFSLSEGMIEWIDCGHNKMILLRNESPHCLLLHGDNLPLGVAHNESYRSRCLPLNPGDRLVLLTDGLIERTSPSGTAVDLVSILNELLRSRNLGIDAVADRILALSEPAPGAIAAADDRTVVVLELAEEPATQRYCRSSFVPSVAILPDARRWLTESIQALVPATVREAAEHDIGSMELGFAEAFANVVRHGINPADHAGGKGSVIWVMAAWRRNAIYVEIQYSGREFEVRRHDRRLPGTEQRAEDGYGLFLIEQCFDTVHYYADPSGTQAVSLGKTLARARAPLQ